jgi:hypothetical protein
MFNVVKSLLIPTQLEGIIGLQPSDSYGLFRDDSGAHLGTVKKGYTIVQNTEILDTFKKACDLAAVDHSEIKFTELAGGRKVAFQLPTASWEINSDPVKRFLTVVNGHDGNSGFGFGFTGIRVFCGNTWYQAMRDKAVTKFRHTSSITDNFTKMADVILASIEEDMVLREAYTVLDSKPFTVAEIDGFALAVLGYDSEEVQKSTRKFNKFETLKDGIAMELASVGATRWGAFNGVTYATNHLFAKDDQLNYLMFQDGGSLNNKAFELLN